MKQFTSWQLPRTYTAKRLLEHGPLALDEFKAITGWRGTTCSSVLQRLRDQGIASIKNINGQRHYALASDTQA